MRTSLPHGPRKKINRAMLALAPVRRVRDAIMRDLALPAGGAPAAARAASVYGEMSALEAAVAGKVVLVTGGSSGIGLAAARLMVAAGAKTIICARDPGKLAEATSALSVAGRSLTSYAVNLADLKEGDALASRLIAEHGGVDVLINNAGRSIRRAIDESLDRFHDFQRTMQLNYFGALRLTMGLLPAMVEKGAGHVINVSSVGVLTNAPRFSAYLASKAAFDTWTQCAAAEYAQHGVLFTTINMPLVKTPMIAPTKAYAQAPALTAEEAGALVANAIVHKPARITTTIGVLSDLLHAAMPGMARTIMTNAFHLEPDEASEP